MAAKKQSPGDASSNGGKRRYPKVRQPVRVKCKAKNRNGKPCGLPPIRGGTVCHKHGGSTRRVKVKAAERLEASRQEMLIMLEPLLGRLHAMALDPNTTDTDVLRVFREVANRVGLSERHVIVPGSESAFDRLVSEDSGLIIQRGSSLREELDAMPQTGELPTQDTAGQGDQPLGGGGGDDALEDFLDKRTRARQREASTRLSNKGHEVVEGSVHQRDSLDMFNREEREREEYARRESEFGPRAPKDDPQRSYEARLREGIERR